MNINLDQKLLSTTAYPKYKNKNKNNNEYKNYSNVPFRANLEDGEHFAAGVIAGIIIDKLIPRCKKGLQKLFGKAVKEAEEISKPANTEKVVNTVKKQTSRVSSSNGYTQKPKSEEVWIPKQEKPTTEMPVAETPVKEAHVNEVTKVETKLTEAQSEEKINKLLNGNQSSEVLASGAKKAAREANEIADMRRSFPELIAHREERSAIIKKNRLKEEDEKIDIQYFKDDFRAFVTIPVDRLNNLRKSTNPELKEMFNIDRTNFLINEGVMINGTNAKAKKELLTHFISEAKKHDMEVIRIPAGDTDPEVFAQKVAELFPKAKLKFANEKKATMFVMEDMDKMLNFKDPKQSALCGPARGQMNVHTNECGTDGVIWVSTVKDVSQLDESSVRGGRIKHIIDIDKIA